MQECFSPEADHPQFIHSVESDCLPMAAYLHLLRAFVLLGEFMVPADVARIFLVLFNCVFTTMMTVWSRVLLVYDT